MSRLDWFHTSETLSDTATEITGSKAAPANKCSRRKPKGKSHMLGLVGNGSQRRSEVWMAAMRARKLQKSQDELGSKSSKAKALDMELNEHYAVRHRDTYKVSRTFDPKRKTWSTRSFKLGINGWGLASCGIYWPRQHEFPDGRYGNETLQEDGSQDGATNQAYDFCIDGGSSSTCDRGYLFYDFDLRN